ncbi:hypothetical protein HZH68_003820 [Vespula germanica]|uniref:Uncharacterized protein n=1 Tax=Vespula germanica TaxID=30212 RepID=A0A836XN47_VESGE|nr:hypothetical protein HZH68_003820 [Vespula germanica]
MCWNGRSYEGGLTRKGRKEDWKRAAKVGHHVNCIPDCGLLKSTALQRLTPSSDGHQPQTGSNKPATTG